MVKKFHQKKKKIEKKKFEKKKNIINKNSLLFIFQNISGEKEVYNYGEIYRVFLPESFIEFLTNFLFLNQKEMKILKFQIENMKINSITMNNDYFIQELKLFSDIDINCLNQHEILSFKIEVELISFGKTKFGEKYENNEKKRFIDKNGNVYFPNGKIK